MVVTVVYMAGEEWQKLLMYVNYFRTILMTYFVSVYSTLLQAMQCALWICKAFITYDVCI